MNAKKAELTAKRDELLKRLDEIQSSTVYKMVEHKEERARLNEELDRIEIALEEMAD